VSEVVQPVCLHGANATIGSAFYIDVTVPASP
jgi:hypothetical protein